MSTTTPRRVLQAIVGAALAAAMGLAGASSANAAPTVDPSATGSITIHKFEQPANGTNLKNDGRELSAADLAGLTPLAGATFKVQKVDGIKLTTNDGWIAANKLVATFNPATLSVAPYTLGAASTLETGNDGIAKFDSLAVGLYLVQETIAPTGATAIVPFLVSIPLTDPTNGNTWMYDINVYPKDAVAGATKTVSDSGAVKIGDAAQFTITGDIPALKVIDGYQIIDDLDSRLDFTGATVSLKDPNNGMTALTAVDYTLTPTVATAGGPEVKVVFTPAGLVKLAANNTSKVVVVINTTVNAIGAIQNTAEVYPNAASFNVKPGQPGGPIVTPVVETKWGSVTITKVNSVDETIKLDGAIFQIFASDPTVGTVEPLCFDTDNNIATPCVKNFSTQGGSVTISGLRLSDFADGATIADPAKWQHYWLVETHAPDGYELLAEPIKFDITQTTEKAGFDLAQTIKNVPANSGFDLPLTGGTGTTYLMVAGGILLIGATTGLVLAARRNRAGNAA